MSVGFFLEDEDWTSLKKEYAERMQTIVIPLDISPGVAKGILARIDRFFSEARLKLSEIAGQKEQVDILIRELEREKANGPNELARKKNATIAVQTYEITPSETVNLYDVQRELCAKEAYFSGIIDILHGKQARLITITGVLKLEKELNPYGEL